MLIDQNYTHIKYTFPLKRIQAQIMHTNAFTYFEQAAKARYNKSSFTSVSIVIVAKLIFKVHNAGNEILTVLYCKQPAGVSKLLESN